MSYMSNLVLEIQTLLEQGKLSFQEIADELEIPVAWIQQMSELEGQELPNPTESV